MIKPRAFIEYEKVPAAIKEHIKLFYPNGFEKHLITFKNKKKHLLSALPFETATRHYLVKMTREQANSIIQNDDDYNENGILKAEKREEYEKNKANYVPEAMTPLVLPDPPPKPEKKATKKKTTAKKGAKKPAAKAKAAAKTKTTAKKK